jgi:membrane protein implicated in regulation of membrane protease activity
MFLLVAIVLLVVLPSPWNAVGFVAGVVLFAGEIVFWNRTVRGRRAAVGVETIVGASATVVSACRPAGQVRARGEIWRAQCADGADPGDRVIVVAQHGLELVVERAAALAR